MTKQFDVIIIGTGEAATTAASQLGAAGSQVAIIDSRPFGGTCALRGCDPKKVLVGVAELRDWISRMKGRGLHTDGARIDWAELIRFKRTFTDPVPKGREQSFTKAGIASFHGRARFVDRTAVQVGDDVLEGRHVVIAAGAVPRPLGVPGEQHVIANEQFLELEKLPGRIVFIGGGYISFEFAHIALRAGAEVTILHRGERPLEGFDPDLVDQLVRKTKRLGGTVEVNIEVKAVEKSADKFTVTASTGSGQKAFDGDLVVHGAGRVPEINDMDLAVASVQAEERGVRVDDYLQSTSNPAVYAAGDAAATGLPKLTPVAVYEGRIVASNLLKGNHRKVEPIAVPTVAFTNPPLAAVGLSERTAKEKGLKFRINKEDTSSWYSSRRVGEDCSGFKVLVEEGNERLLGAHLIGPHVDELINVFALAIQTGLSASKLKRGIFSYPTLTFDVQYMV